MLVECVKRCLLYSKGYIREGRYCSVIVLVPQYQGLKSRQSAGSRQVNK